MYIIDYSPKKIGVDNNLLSQIEEKVINKQEVTDLEIQYLLTYLTYTSRKRVGKTISDPCLNKCDTVQSMITSYLNRLGVTTHLCTTQNVITNGIVGHSFLTADFNGKSYLIDPTYQQFLLSQNCNESKFFHHQGVTILKPDPGYYIKEENKPLLEGFVNNGFGLLTEELAQMYGDSFYNTKQGTLAIDKSFKTIPGANYISAFQSGNEKQSKDDNRLKEKELFIELAYNDGIRNKSL